MLSDRLCSFGALRTHLLFDGHRRIFIVAFECRREILGSVTRDDARTRRAHERRTRYRGENDRALAKQDITAELLRTI